MSNTSALVASELKKISSPAKAEHLKGFFKTGKGQYGEGDVFIGVTVPENRAVAKKYFKEISLAEVEKLLQSSIHEHRLCALIMMRMKYEAADDDITRAKIAKLYLKNTKHINNWDLVDLSAAYILGPWFYGKELDGVYKLAHSKFLWEERISLLISFYFIRQGDYGLTLELCEFFINHKHDLMHKAAGWMLREMGKRDVKPLLEFLDVHAAVMPRTMLRYSVEKLPQNLKDKYMRAANDIY